MNLYRSILSNPKFTIIDESEHYLVVNKPAPLLIHPSVPGNPPTLLDGVQDLLAYEMANGAALSIINRLDRETSGLVLVAKNLSTARNFHKAMERRQSRKEYLAIVWGWLPTTIGTYIVDTAGSYHYKFHYNQISAMGRKEKTNFNVKGSGAALLGGGILLTLASGVVYLVDPEKFSAPLMFTSMGLATIGYFMAKGKKGGGAMVIGKKYRLVYMNMSNQKN